MFESAELGHSISKRTYLREMPKLREALLDAQYDLFLDSRFPVMVLIRRRQGRNRQSIERVDGSAARSRCRVRRTVRWEAYEQAVCDMVDRTSTADSPWTLVEANDKLYARIKVLKTICERLESAVKVQ